MTYLIVLNHCSFIINANSNGEAMKFAEEIEVLCDKNIIADEPLEIINFTVGTCYDGTFHQHNPDHDGFTVFEQINNDDIDARVYVNHPIVPTKNNLEEIETYIQKYLPKEHKPQNKGRYSKYL